MKKLSMLAAGVAVLSLCACTEANEFTPSTNGNTKKITEIKVSSNPSALATRTVFHTGDDEFVYGVVTWEEGVDQIYFYKNATNSQSFTCDKHDSEHDNYYWNYFIADDAGLDVGSTYYVNNKPTGFDYEDPRGVPCASFEVPINLKYQQDGSEDKVLQQFMKNYDLLMSKSPVLAEETMDPIYMDHAFSLIAVDLQCTNPGDFKDNSNKPLFYEIDLSVKDGNGASCFGNAFYNDNTGKLTFHPAPSKDSHVATKLLDAYTEYWALDETEKKDKLTFYLLLHSTSQVSELSFMICTQSRKGGASDTTDKTATLTLETPFTFELGKIYHFSFGIDYQPSLDGHPYNLEQFNYKFDWVDIGGQLSLCSIPNGMKVKSVEYSTPQ